MIPTYMEIEGKSEEEVLKIVDMLGIDKNKVTSRDVEGIYQDYGHKLEEIKELKLEEERL